VAKALKEKRRERRVREILEAAMAVFEEKGYLKATMEEIAERALLSRVALYNYFRDKEELLKALLLWKLEELTERLGAVAKGPYAEAVAAMAQAGVAFQEENRGFLRALYSASALPELVRDREFQANKERLVRLVESVIQRGQAAGEARPGDAKAWAGLFLSLVFSATAKDYFEPEDPPTYDAAPIVDLFLKGTAKA